MFKNSGTGDVTWRFMERLGMCDVQFQRNNECRKINKILYYCNQIYILTIYVFKCKSNLCV